MTFIKTRFSSFEEYLTEEEALLPEGRCEYWDGELIPVPVESLRHDSIANYLLILLFQTGINFSLVSPGSVEIETIGRTRTRFPDLTVLDDVHLTLLARRATVTCDMPPPRIVAEVVSPGDEDSDEDIRNYKDKRDQYAAIGIPEYWLVDPDREWVKVGTLVSGVYQFMTFQGEDAIASPTFPELKLTAAQALGAGQSSTEAIDAFRLTENVFRQLNRDLKDRSSSPP